MADEPIIVRVLGDSRQGQKAVKDQAKATRDLGRAEDDASKSTKNLGLAQVEQGKAARMTSRICSQLVEQINSQARATTGAANYTQAWARQLAGLTREQGKAAKAADKHRDATGQYARSAGKAALSTQSLTDAAHRYLREATQATRSTKQLNTQLEDTAREAHQAAVGLDHASRSADRFGSSAKDAHHHGQALSTWLHGARWTAGALGITGAAQAITAAAAAAVAAVNAVKPLAVSVAALPALYTTAGQAVGVWKLATWNLTDALKANQDQLKHYSPEMQRLVKVIKALKPEFNHLRRTAEKGLFPGVEDGIKLAVRNLPVVKALVRDTSKALGGMAREAGREAGNAWWARDLTAVGQRNVRYLKDLGEAGLNVANTLRHITVAAKPVTDFAVHGALELSKRLEEWAQLNRQNGGLRVMFEEAVRSARGFITIGRDLATTVKNVSDAGQALSGGIVKSLGEGAANMAKWTSSLHGQVKLREYFANAKPVIDEVGRLFRDILLQVAKLGAGKDLAPLIYQIRTELLPQLTAGLAKMQETFGPSLVGALTNLSRLMESLSGPVSTVVDGIATVVDGINAIIAGSPVLRDAMGAMVGAALAWRLLNFTGLIGGAQKLLEIMRGVQAAAAGTAAASAASAASAGAAGAAGAAAGAAGAAGAAAGASRYAPVGRTVVGGNTGRTGQALPATPVWQPTRAVPVDAYNPRATQSTAIGRGVNRALMAGITKSIGFVAIAAAITDGIITALEKDGNFETKMRAADRKIVDDMTFTLSQHLRDSDMSREVRGALDNAINQIPYIGPALGSKGLDIMGMQIARDFTKSVKKGIDEFKASEDIKSKVEVIKDQFRGLLRPEAFKLKFSTKFADTFQPIIDKMRELPPKARQEMAKTVVEMAAGLERKKELPKGATAKIIRLINSQFLELPVITGRVLDQLVGNTRTKLDHLSKMRLGLTWAADMAADGRLAQREIDRRIRDIQRLPKAYRSETSRALLGQTAVLVQQGKLPVAAFHQLQESMIKEGVIGRRRSVEQAAKMGDGIAEKVKAGGGKARKSMKFTKEQIVAMAKNMHSQTIAPIGVLSQELDAALRKLGAKPIKFSGSIGKAASYSQGSGNLRDAAGPTVGGFAEGGYVGSPGERGRDTVPVNVPAGTAVLNRHQQPFADMAMEVMRQFRAFAKGGLVGAVVGRGERIVPPGRDQATMDTGLHLMGMGGLAGLFDKIKTPHYLASGGFTQVPMSLTGTYDKAQLAALWVQAGGPKNIANLMAAIALAESGGRAKIVNSIGAAGLWQIYGLPFPGDPLDPLTNARMAVAKYHDQGLGAWEAYTKGMHTQFMGGQGIGANDLIAGMPTFEKLARARLSGPAGQLRSIGQAVLDKVRDAANAYGEKQVGGLGDISGFAVKGGANPRLHAFANFLFSKGLRPWEATFLPGGVQGTEHKHYGAPDHYSGGAMDIPVPSTAMGDWVVRWVQQWVQAGKLALWGPGVLWQVPDHYTHVHVSAHEKGGIVGRALRRFAGGGKVAAQRMMATYFNDQQGYKGDNLYKSPLAYAELGYGSGWRMGNLPYKAPLDISFRGKTVRGYKLDIGAGAPGAKIDLHKRLADALGFTRYGKAQVTVSSPGKGSARVTAGTGKKPPKPTLLSAVQAQMLRRPLTDDAFTSGMALGQTGARRLGLDFLTSVFDTGQLPVGTRLNMSGHRSSGRGTAQHPTVQTIRRAMGGLVGEPRIVGPRRGVAQVGPPVSLSGRGMPQGTSRQRLGPSPMDRIAHTIGTSMYERAGQEILTQLTGLVSTMQGVTVQALVRQRDRIVRRITELERGGVTSGEQKLITGLRGAMSVLTGEMGRRVGLILHGADKLATGAQTHATATDQAMRLQGIDSGSARGLGMQRREGGYQLGALAGQADIVRRAIQRARAAGDKDTIRELNERLNGLKQEWQEALVSWVERGREIVTQRLAEKADRTRATVDRFASRASFAAGDLEEFDLRQQLGLTRKGETRGGYALASAIAMGKQLGALRNAATAAWNRGDMGLFGEMLTSGKELQRSILSTQLEALQSSNQGRIDATTQKTTGARRLLEQFDLRAQLGLKQGGDRKSLVDQVIKGLVGERATLETLGVEAKKRGDTKTWQEFMAASADKTTEILQAQLELQQQSASQTAEQLNELLKQQLSSTQAALRVSQAQYPVLSQWVQELAGRGTTGHLGGFASGGAIVAPVHLRGLDQLTANVSHGEYMIRRAAARKIGYSRLEAMNRTGSVPGPTTVDVAPPVVVVNVHGDISPLITKITHEVAKPGGAMDRRIGRNARSRALAPGR